MSQENETELTRYQQQRAEHGLDPLGEQLEGFHYVMWEDEKEDGRRYYLNIGTETIQFAYESYEAGFIIEHYLNCSPCHTVSVAKQSEFDIRGPRPECYTL